MTSRVAAQKLNLFCLGDTIFYLPLAFLFKSKQFNVMAPKKPLRSREERTYNVVSIEPHDHTSNAYRPEQPRRSDMSFGFYLSIAIITFVTILFFSIYELAVESWQRFK